LQCFGGHHQIKNEDGLPTLKRLDRFILDTPLPSRPTQASRLWTPPTRPELADIESNSAYLSSIDVKLGREECLQNWWKATVKKNKDLRIKMKAIANGIKVNYRVSGHGPCGPWIILSHPVSTNMEIWEPQAVRLKYHLT